jgi:hypothetical protein
MEKHTQHGPLVLSTFTVIKDLLVLALQLEKFCFVHAPCCQCCVRRAQFSPNVDIQVFGNKLLIQDKDIGESYNFHLKQFSVQ